LHAAVVGDQLRTAAGDHEPGDQEQGTGGEPVVDHIEGGADLALAGHRENAQGDQPEVGHRGIGDQPFQVSLADGHDRAVQDPDHGERDDQGREVVRRRREQLQAVADHAERADLIQHPDQQHRRARLGGGGRIGQPGMERPQRRLDRERDEEAEEHPLLRGRAEGGVDQLAELERARVAAARRVDIERDHRDQHEQAAEQAVQQELHRRVLSLAGTVTADHEVHRDEHGLEEHVKQEDVRRREDADHHRLEHQHQREVGLHAAPRRRLLGRARDAFGIVPGREDHHRHEDCGHQDEDERDPVHADRIVHAELRDPLVGLGELEVRAARPERDRHRDGDPERDQREP
jgi:hypothetical protein